MKNLKIAVTGLNAGNNPGPGLHIIRSIGEAHMPGTRIIGLSHDIFFPGVYESSLLDEAYIVPYPAEGEAPLLSRIKEINKLVGVDVIIPSSDAEVVLYSSLKAEIRKLGIRMLIPKLETVQLRSKQLLPGFCKKNTFNTPQTSIIYDYNDLQQSEDIGYPSFLKGTFTDAKRVNNAEEAAIFFNRLNKEWGLPLLRQQVISGEEYDVVALADEKSNTVGKVAMKKFGITDKGKAWAGATVADNGILALTDKVVKALGWVGPLELELIKENISGKLYIIEINPRFPTWITLATRAGQNLPLTAIKLALGEKVRQFHTYKLGTLFVRSMEETICGFERISSLAAHGHVKYHNHKKKR